MKRMKAIATLALCSVMVLGGCGSTPAESSQETQKESSSSQETQQESIQTGTDYG